MRPSSDDTIAAISTAPGRSGRGIVRLSGSRAFDITGKLTFSPLHPPSGYSSLDCSVPINGTELPCVIYCMSAPRSYTREDVAEIHTLGAPALLETLLERLLELGARPAEPGEFTRRAFVNGRIDLAQAEAVLSVIRSRTLAEEKAAQRALSGELSDEISMAREKLEALCIEVEASIDVLEEGIDSSGTAKRLESVLDSLPLPDSTPGSIAEEGITTVIVGRPNAGKSTLFNRLADRDHALVSEVPGTTRDWLSCEIEIEGVRFLLVDTAGNEPASSGLDKTALDMGRRQADSAQIIILVVDGSRPLEPDPLHTPEAAGTLVAINKIDLPRAAEASEVRTALPDVQAVSVSALTGEGMDDLKTALGRMVWGSQTLPGQPTHAALSTRQRYTLREARNSVRRGTNACSRGLDLAAHDIREALTYLGSFLGDSASDEILDAIFSEFCVGK